MSPKQAVFLVVLMGASAAVWVPQFAGDKNTNLAELSVSPEPIDVLEGGIEAMPGGGSAVIPSGPLAVHMAGPQAAPTPGIDGEEVASSATTDTLDVATLLGSLQSFRPEGTVSIAEDSEEARDQLALTTAGIFEVRAAIAEYPLTAILYTESGGRAVMGGRILEVGAELRAGVKIERIERRAVWLESAAGETEIHLPALRSRPATSGSTGSTVQEGGSDEGGGEQEPGQEPSAGSTSPTDNPGTQPQEVRVQSVQGAGL